MKTAYYIGIMSGTSLDGIDAVLADFSSSPPSLLHAFYLPYDPDLRSRLLDLHLPGHDELHRAAMLGNELAHHYAEAVAGLLRESRCKDGGSGRDRMPWPDGAALPAAGRGYTIQLCNPALLVELIRHHRGGGLQEPRYCCGRARCAPGPGISSKCCSVTRKFIALIVNIGGISNLTVLPPNGEVTGFDCGPGNIMMDAWCLRHTGKTYDENGSWAASGGVIPALLEKLLATSIFFSSTTQKRWKGNIQSRLAGELPIWR